MYLRKYDKILIRYLLEYYWWNFICNELIAIRWSWKNAVFWGEGDLWPLSCLKSLSFRAKKANERSTLLMEAFLWTNNWKYYLVQPLLKKEFSYLLLISKSSLMYQIHCLYLLGGLMVRLHKIERKIETWKF